MSNSPSAPRTEGRHSPYLSIHAVTVYVRDQERSLRFYVEQLGFSLAFDAQLQTGDRWVAVAPPDGSAVLSLVAPKPDSRECELIGRPTPVVFVTENVTAKYKEWSSRGVRFVHAPRLRRVKYERPMPDAAPAASAVLAAPVWGGVFTRFKDLDGNSFALVGLDEVSREVESRRRAAAERLESERRAAQELEIAKQVQARLFPQRLPHVRTLDYAGVCIQARQVGGDYYDFLDLGRERFGLVIGDIAGKGMAAALLMANLQANLRSQCAIALDDPRRFLESVNQLFCQSTADGAYATLLFIEYDEKTRQVRYVNCGHLSALLLRRDGTLERLDSTATVLGLFTDWCCAIGESTLFPGDTLALYTDGITECFNEAGDEFGEQRLIDALRCNHELAPRPLVGAIVDQVHRFSPLEQSDDVTLIVAKGRDAGDAS